MSRKWTLLSHFLNTSWAGVKGFLEDSSDTRRDTLLFRDTLSRASWGTSGPKGPKTLVGGRVFLKPNAIAHWASPKLGAEKAHKHLAHKQFLGHPGHRSSRPGTRFLPAGCPDENVYVPWVPHTAHKLLTPGHRSGDPPHPVGRPPPPPGQSPEKYVYVYVPFPFLINPYILNPDISKWHFSAHGAV